MKIELILSKTYVHGGKVYNRGVVYEVPKKAAKHLLGQSNERNVFYFRRAMDDDALAHLAPKKSINKGGVPIPIDESGADADTTPDPADDDDDATAVDADGEEVDDDADADEDDGEGEEAVTV